MSQTKITRESVKGTTISFRVNDAIKVKISENAKRFGINKSTFIIKATVDLPPKYEELFKENNWLRARLWLCGERPERQMTLATLANAYYKK